MTILFFLFAVLQFALFEAKFDICKKYTILPRNDYTVQIIFGNFVSLKSIDPKKLVFIATNPDPDPRRKGSFEWDFEEMVLENEAVEKKDDEKVTILLCKNETAECRVYRVWGTYAQMKADMERGEHRFYGGFQVMFDYYGIYQEKVKSDK